MRPKDVESRHLRVVFSFLAFRSRHLPRYASLFRIANCYFASSRYGRIRFPSIRSARRSRGDLSTRPSTKSGGYPFERILGVEYESNTSRTDSIRRQSQGEETRRSGVRHDERVSRVRTLYEFLLSDLQEGVRMSRGRTAGSSLPARES